MNGWKNWETWNFNLWLTNDESYMDLIDDIGLDGIEDYLKDMLYEQIRELPAGFVQDAATMSVEEIDFKEIIESLKEEIENET